MDLSRCLRSVRSNIEKGGTTATFVLVPGGWHGGWYFQSVAEALRGCGHRAYPTTLTGLGERRHLLRGDVNLDTHVEDVVRLLQAENLSKVILVGHSYGGMVISGVIDRAPDRVAAAIYSDACVPDDGQSWFDLVNDLYRKLFHDGAAQDGFSAPPPPGLDPRATPHPVATFLQRSRLRNAPPRTRRGYIFLSGWPETPFTSVYERLRASPEWWTFVLPVGHNVVADAFDQFLEIVLEFA
jgi:pimeloyl-ACP methyl ester carboxylesterase